MLYFSFCWHRCKLHWKQLFIYGWMAITILVFMASMGTWWIVPSVGFHLHMRALSACHCPQWERRTNEWIWMRGLTPTVAHLWHLHRLHCSFAHPPQASHTFAWEMPPSILTYLTVWLFSPIRCLVPASSDSKVNPSYWKHRSRLCFSLLKCFTTAGFVCAVALRQASTCQKLFNCVWSLLKEPFPGDYLTKPRRPHVQLEHNVSWVLNNMGSFCSNRKSYLSPFFQVNIQRFK